MTNIIRNIMISDVRIAKIKANTNIMSDKIRSVPTSKTKGVIKLRISPREIPGFKSNILTSDY